MTEIYLIRHAEAEGNLFRRAQGRWNGKITPRGYKQIDALAARFSGVRLDAVYSSDLSRAMTTAGGLTRGRALELATTPRLTEMSFGDWEGESWGNLAHDFPEKLRSMNTDLEHWAVPGSESADSVRERMLSVIREIAARYEGGTVAVVSHGMAIKVFLLAAMGLVSGEAAQVSHGDNTSVSLLRVENGDISVAYHNDGSHLGELSTFARQSWWKDDGGVNEGDLRFVPLDPTEPEGAAYYTKCYRDAWVASHGTAQGFAPELYLSSARRHAKRSSGCLLRVFSDEREAGLLELDPTRGAEKGLGWVSLLYLNEDFRGRGLGVQLIGAADVYFSRERRRAVRLHVAVTNGHATGFYEHYGFRVLATEPGVASDQYLMEREI